MSAMPSGPRALAGTEASRLAAAERDRNPHQAQAAAQGGSGTGHVGLSPKGSNSDPQCARTGPRRKHLQLIFRRKTGPRRLTIALTPQLLARRERHQSSTKATLRGAIARQRILRVPDGQLCIRGPPFGPSEKMTVNAYRRTNQIRTRPTTAETMPTDAQDIVRRRQRALHRPAHPGRAGGEHQAFEHEEDAQTDEEVVERYGPHRTTSPRYSSVFCFYAAKRPPLRRRIRRTPIARTLRLRAPRRRRRMAGRIGEEAEELGIRPQQEAGVVGTEPGLVGRHRAVEGEEVRIPAIGLGEQAVALGIADAARSARRSNWRRRR